jgi:hypothetical protein
MTTKAGTARAGEAMRESLEPTTSTPSISPETLEMDRDNRIKFREVRNEIIPFTLDLATKFIEMKTFIGERVLKSKHVDKMVSDAKKGKFLNTEAGLASCNCEWDGTERRLNGQHTCWMRTYMPANWCPNIRVTKYSVPSDSDFRELYCTFDINAPRTVGQKTVAVLLGSEGFEDITNERLLQDLKAAMSLWIGAVGGTGCNRFSFDEIMDLMQGKHYKVVIDVGNHLKGLSFHSAPHMVHRASVTAAMFSTFSKNVAESTEFWNMVKDGGSPSHPAVVLNKYLHRTRLHSGQIEKHYTRVSSEEMLRICIVAWNAYRRKDELKILRNPDRRPAAL